MKNDFIENVLACAALKLNSLYLGIRTKEARTTDDLERVLAFKLKNDSDFTENSPLDIQKQMSHLKDLSHCFYLEKNGDIIATVSLRDSANSKPKTEYKFQDSILCYNPKTTFELGDLVTDNNDLHLLILLNKCYKMSRRKSKTNWLVSSGFWKYHQVKKICGEVEKLCSKKLESTNVSKQNVSQYNSDYLAYLVNSDSKNYKKRVRLYFKLALRKLLKLNIAQPLENLEETKIWIN